MPKKNPKAFDLSARLRQPVNLPIAPEDVR
jgi:hypothetical protein